MMTALKEVAEEVVEGTEETENPVLKYHNKYYEAMAHSFTATDPAGSDAANAISSYFGISSYPTLTFNFLTDIKSTANAEVIKQQIDALWKESADAGIAASASFAPPTRLVATVHPDCCMRQASTHLPLFLRNVSSSSLPLFRG